MPEIVELEITKNIARRCGEIVSDIDRSYEWLDSVVGTYVYALPSGEEIESAIKKRLDSLVRDSLRMPFTMEHAKAALMRVNEGSPPNSAKNQQFKDSAIWEAVLDLASMHTVHFVTRDAGFYEGRDSKKGLASNLRRQCESQGKVVYLHCNLSSLLLTLKTASPVLDRDYEFISRTLANGFRDKWQEWAQARELQIGELASQEIWAFTTEEKGSLALGYEFRFDAFALEASESLQRAAGTLVVKGSGIYYFESREVPMATIDSVRYFKPDGSEVIEKCFLASQGAVGFPGTEMATKRWQRGQEVVRMRR